MMQLFTRPLRVYITLGALALWGIVSGLQLPYLFVSDQQPNHRHGGYSCWHFISHPVL